MPWKRRRLWVASKARPTLLCNVALLTTAFTDDLLSDTFRARSQLHIAQIKIVFQRRRSLR